MQSSNTLLSSIDAIKVSLRRLFGTKTNHPENNSHQKSVASNTRADWYELTHGNTDGVIANHKEAG